MHFDKKNILKINRNYIVNRLFDRALFQTNIFFTKTSLF